MKNKEMEQLLKENTYYAHREDSKEKELLSSHLELTYAYYKKMEKYKNLDKKVKDMIQKTFKVEGELTQKIYEMFEQAIYYHDIGKINPLFQKNKMQNDLHIKMEIQDDTHAALSARIYVDSLLKEILEETSNYEIKQKTVLVYVTYYFGYVISRHHTSLEGIHHFEDAIKNKNIPQLEEAKEALYKAQLAKLDLFLEKVSPDAIGLYILCKLLYSVLIDADFYATYEYMSGKEVPIEEKKQELFTKYKESELYKSIQEYGKGKKQIEGINKIRSDIFLETQKELWEHLGEDIYYIEAPTGSGKTNMAINIAKILYEQKEDIKSISYIFPFNTIIEQTNKTFEQYFEAYQDYVVVNSITSMAKDVGENMDYEEVYVKHIFKQYPIVLTSHVNLFETLFGQGKEGNYSLYHLVDSVIILDEIQAYSNSIWRQMIEMFSKYAKSLNIKFVIMSATLPRLDFLLQEKIVNFYPLVRNTKKYYQNVLFKNRVKLKFDLLERKINIQELEQEILKHRNKKILVECIKKDTADTLYEMLKAKRDNVYILTGDDNKYNRNHIIQMTKEKEDIVVVATQTIEAGVDIDMDIGFKDISFLDSEEQFIGRINRSAKKENCTAFFFNLDDARSIYKEDNRLEFSLEKEEVKTWLQEKDFHEFYEKVMQKIFHKTQMYTKDNIENFYQYCLYIDYKQIYKEMKLIQNHTVQLFLNHRIEVNGQWIEGKEIFKKYQEICEDRSLSYVEKRVKLSSIQEEFNLFIYSIFEGTPVIEVNKYRGIFYIENGEKYMEGGRFNRKKYLNGGDGLFL